MKAGPIILVEDDEDDKFLFETILEDLAIKNKLNWFSSCHEAHGYLQTTSDHPFIIICDLNLPAEKGLEFKKRIDSDPYLRRKSIPFIFYSTSVDQRSINEAYTEMTVQGFFKKDSGYNTCKDTIKRIIDYWLNCYHPNSA